MDNPRTERCYQAHVYPSNRFALAFQAMAVMHFPTEPDFQFDFYDDEIKFTPEELVGLTVEEAVELYHKKDIAYLQAP